MEPIDTLSKMLGHKSLKQTQHYAKILDKKVSFDMQALRIKLSETLPVTKNQDASFPKEHHVHVAK